MFVQRSVRARKSERCEQSLRHFIFITRVVIVVAGKVHLFVFVFVCELLNWFNSKFTFLTLFLAIFNSETKNT